MRAYAGDGEQFGDRTRRGDGEVADDGIAKDDEGGPAGFGGFGFTPGAEACFKIGLFGGEIDRNVFC